MNDGGPAFPNTHVHSNQTYNELIPGWHGTDGMSLRAYIATKAMQVYATANIPLEEVAMQSVKMADALIKELEAR